MHGWPILSLTTFLPLAGAVLILVLARGGNEAEAARTARWIAIWTTLLTFIVSLVIWIEFDNANPGFQFEERSSWLGYGIEYRMGVDGISMLFVILTTFLMPVCILARSAASH